MRIAVFAYTDDAPTLDTGVTTYNRELVTRLCERFPAYSFSLFLAPKNSEKFADVEFPNLTKIVLPREGSGRGDGPRGLGGIASLVGFAFRELLHRIHLLRFAMGRQLYGSLDQLGMQDLVIYTVFGLFPDFPLYVKRKFGVTCVSAIHDVRVLYSKPDSFKRLISLWRQRYVLSRIVREGDHALVPSNYIREILLSRFAPDPASVCVSYMVPDTVTTAGDIASYSPLVRDILMSARRYIFYPSTMVETKNHLRLAQAIELLKQSAPDVMLVLAGSNRDSELGKELFRYIAAHELTQNIVHVGFVSDAEKTSLYQNAVALVVPSIGESFSLPIWEAFASGCPVVASTDRDIPEQVQSAALLCDPTRPEDIAAKIAMVWLDRDGLRQQLIESGRARYEDAKQNSLFSGWQTIIEAGRVETSRAETSGAQGTSGESAGSPRGRERRLTPNEN